MRTCGSMPLYGHRDPGELRATRLGAAATRQRGRIWRIGCIHRLARARTMASTDTPVHSFFIPTWLGYPRDQMAFWARGRDDALHNMRPTRQDGQHLRNAPQKRVGVCALTREVQDSLEGRGDRGRPVDSDGPPTRSGTTSTLRARLCSMNIIPNKIVDVNVARSG